MLKLGLIKTVGYCRKCNAELIVKRGLTEMRGSPLIRPRFVCPNRRFWNRGHYRGFDDKGYAAGSWSTERMHYIDIPELDSCWNLASNPPTKAGDYETIDARFDACPQVLFKSVSSGGWWYPKPDGGYGMFQGMITHWRPIQSPCSA